MRSTTIYFEDSEFEQLLLKKGERSWHDFVIQEILEERFEDG